MLPARRTVRVRPLVILQQIYGEAIANQIPAARLRAERFLAQLDSFDRLYLDAPPSSPQNKELLLPPEVAFKEKRTEQGNKIVIIQPPLGSIPRRGARSRKLPPFLPSCSRGSAREKHPPATQQLRITAEQADAYMYLYFTHGFIRDFEVPWQQTRGLSRYKGKRFTQDHFLRGKSSFSHPVLNLTFVSFAWTASPA